jgi:dTDP-4-amino-4,6-dideoxygalactose transaminase
MLTLSIFDDETIRSVFEHKPDELIIDGDFKATYNICIGEYVPLVSIPKFRTWLRDEMKKKNIDTRPVFPAISQYPIWIKKQETQPVAKEIGDTAINLPSGVCLKEDQIDYVCKVIRELV